MKLSDPIRKKDEHGHPMLLSLTGRWLIFPAITLACRGEYWDATTHIQVGSNRFSFACAQLDRLDNFWADMEDDPEGTITDYFNHQLVFEETIHNPALKKPTQKGANDTLTLADLGLKL